MNCRAKNCLEQKNIQFLLVMNSSRPKIEHKEYYCPKHLRKRAYQLECLKVTSKITKEIEGWK